jgi:tetratricopeptide (TPR) repeat protein
VRFLLVLALLLPLSGQTLDRALAEIDAGHYEPAIRMLRELAVKTPDDVAVHFNLALALGLAGQDEEAVVLYRKVLEMRPELMEARMNLAQLLVRDGHFAEAPPLLEAVIEKRPADARAFALLGRAWLGLREWAKATAAYEKALELDPKDEPSALELAGVCEKTEHAARAIEIYGRFPESAAANERRGVLQLKTGDAHGAIESLERARAVGSTPAVLYALATAYLRDKQLDKATPLATALVQAEPRNVETRLFLGRLLRDQRRYDEAARAFEQVVQLKPDLLEGWNELSGMLLLAKRWEDGLRALDRVRALGGETPAYHYFRALMLDSLHQNKMAVESYKKFLELAGGKFPEEEFMARHRIKALDRSAR